MSTRLTKKPGADLTTTGDLPMASAKLAPSATASSELNLERITSTSGNCGTGLKKCSPISRDLSFNTSAMRSSSIDEVLVARIAPGLICFSASAKILLLDVELFDHRLDHHIGAGNAVAGDIGLQPRLSPP